VTNTADGGSEEAETGRWLEEGSDQELGRVGEREGEQEGRDEKGGSNEGYLEPSWVTHLEPAVHP
jgi:hypothetical protein